MGSLNPLPISADKWASCRHEPVSNCWWRTVTRQKITCLSLQISITRTRLSRIPASRDWALSCTTRFGCGGGSSLGMRMKMRMKMRINQTRATWWIGWLGYVRMPSHRGWLHWTIIIATDFQRNVVVPTYPDLCFGECQERQPALWSTKVHLGWISRKRTPTEHGWNGLQRMDVLEFIVSVFDINICCYFSFIILCGSMIGLEVVVKYSFFRVSARK